MRPFTKTRAVLIVMMTACSLLLLSCGRDTHTSTVGTISAPATATVTFSPDASEWKTGLTAGCQLASPLTTTNTNDTPFVITLKDGNGNLLNDVTIYVYLDLSAGSAGPGIQAMDLYDADTNPPTLVTSPYKTKTGTSGTKNMRVRVDLGGCEYTGQLSVTSGAAHGSAEIKVTTS